MFLNILPFRISLLLLAFLCIYIGIPNSYAGCGKELDQSIQDSLDRNRLLYRIPGAEVSLICPGEMMPHDFVSGTITLNGNVAVKNDHLFQIGSETKSFIAAVLLQLESEGLLSLNDSIGKWLPNINTAWKEITITQLLNHTSGIFNYTDVLDEMVHNGQYGDFKKQLEASELINMVSNRPSYFAPGTGWHYSNTNYILAGMILERVTGKSVDEELKARVINPLRLTNTYYLPYSYSEQIMQRMAHGYSERGYFPDEPKDITDINNSWANAAGAIVANSHDLAVWFKHLMNGSLLLAGQMDELRSLVDKKTGQPLSTISNQPGYGLGIMHDIDRFGEEAWWHTGGTLGYSAMMIWLKCSDVIITANINHISSTRDIYMLIQDLISIIQKSDQSKRCYINKKSIQSFTSDTEF